MGLTNPIWRVGCRANETSDPVVQAELLSSSESGDSTDPSVFPPGGKATERPEDFPTGPVEDFDLAPFRVQLKAARRAGLWILVLIGCAGVVAGVAVASFVAFGTSFSWGVFVAVVALVSALGFLPLALAYVPSREWRYPKTLRVDEKGFRIIDSGGKELRFRWDQQTLVLSARERLPSDGNAGAMGQGDYLVTVPYAVCVVPPAARETLLIEASANGLTVVEDRFVAADGDPSGPAIPSVTRTAMRVFAGDHASATLHPDLDTPAPDRTEIGTYVLPEAAPPRPDRLFEGGSPNPITSMIVTESGLSFRLRNGLSRDYSWESDRWQAFLTRRMGNPLERVADPSAVWHLRLTSPTLAGAIDSTAYSALLRACERGRREVASTRFPDPAPPHSTWVAETNVRFRVNS